MSWLEVHEFVEAMTAHANCGPLLWPGTPLWCQLSDGDPRKLLAVAQFGVHHALRVEVAQQASCEASHEISAGADWAAISQRIRTDAEFYAAKPFLRMRP